MGENDMNDDLKKLLAGDVVPIHHISHKPSGKLAEWIPLVKRTIGYIAMGIVFDDKGRLLLIQEAKQSCRGSWYIPAGRVEPNENLIDGVRREVLEEAGVELDLITFCCIEMYGSLSWFRFVYTARQSGGKLKTLAEADSESLQAGWFTLDEIKNGFVELRHKDFLTAVSVAQDYLSRAEDKRHPPYHIGIHPHNRLIFRPLIVKQSTEGVMEVLCAKQSGPCLPVMQVNKDDQGLNVALHYLFKDVFNVKKDDSALLLPTRGLVTLEHCGIPERQNDGICITTAYLVPEVLHDKLANIPNQGFMWHTVTDTTVVEELKRRVYTDNMLVPVVEKHKI